MARSVLGAVVVAWRFSDVRPICYQLIITVGGKSMSEKMTVIASLVWLCK